jgi:hypothetical protein
MFSQKDTYVKQPTEIEKYVQGDEFTLKVMQNLQKNIGQRPEIKETGGSWLSIFGIGEKAKPDSTEYKEWEAKKQKLDKAIEVRTSIDKGNLCDSVVKNYYYSEQQSKFKESIGKIDSSKCQDVSEQIGDISSLSLSQIAKKINAILSLPEKNKSKTDKNNENGHNQNGDLEEELQSATITKQRLQEISEANFSKLNNSIALYKEFFDLVGKSNKKEEFDTLLKKIKNDNILKDSKLKYFLNIICASSDEFKRFNALADKTNIKTLSELKSKLGIVL